jgi:hypothetical protein
MNEPFLSFLTPPEIAKLKRLHDSSIANNHPLLVTPRDRPADRHS